jgi:hypothetical protein
MRPGARMFVGAAGIAVLIVGGLNLRWNSVTAEPATAVRASRQQVTEARRDAPGGRPGHGRGRSAGASGRGGGGARRDRARD